MAEEEIIDWAGDTATASANAIAANKASALTFASNYTVFTDDERGRQLLAHWVKTIEDRDLNPAASHAEYAYHEGRRAFVRGIQRQIEFYHKERTI